MALFLAEAPVGADVVLDPEHDTYRWLLLDEATLLCLPAGVAHGLRHAACYLT